MRKGSGVKVWGRYLETQLKLMGEKHFQHYSSLAYRFENRDRILNRDDECPDTIGLLTLNGCPETDLDGIRDLEDKCIDVPGIPSFKGCQDTD